MLAQLMELDNKSVFSETYLTTFGIYYFMWFVCVLLVVPFVVLRFWWNPVGYIPNAVVIV